MLDTIRRTFRIFIPRGERRRWVGLTVLALGVAGAEMVTGFLIFRVLELTSGPQDGPIELLWGIELDTGPLILAAGLAFIFRAALGMVNVYLQAQVIQGSAARVSALVHRRYLQAPYSFHLMRSSSESIRTVLWSVDQAALNSLNPIVNIATQSLIALALFGLLIGIAPLMSLIAIVVLGGSLGLIFLFVQPRLARLGHRSEEAIKNILRSVRDSFDSVRDIKAYREEDFFDGRFRRHRRDLARVRVTKGILEKIPPTGIELIVIGGLLVLVAIAQTGDSFAVFIPILGAFGYATLRIVPSLTKVVSGLNRLRFANQSVRNVEHDLRSAVPEEPPPPTPGLPRDRRLFEDSIVLDRITFEYPGGTKALDDVSIEVRRGEMLAVAGSSGSGKSTLADVILRLLVPQTGTITVDGSSDLPPDWHEHVGIVSQTVVLLDGTLRENVAFGAGVDADDGLVRRSMEWAQLGEWLESLPAGLDTLVGEGGKLLSGGERQRVAIARSLYRRPDLLILDEATSALDGATEAALMESLAGLSDTLTTVIVSHRVAPIQKADRVAMMEQGRITAIGTYEDLVTKAVDFRDLVGL